MSEATPTSRHFRLFVICLVDLTRPLVRFTTLRLLELAGCRISVPEQNPTTLNFLPPFHFAVLKAADIAGSYEDVWTKLRSDWDDEGQSFSLIPRTVNMITGPFHTGDI